MKRFATSGSVSLQAVVGGRAEKSSAVASLSSPLSVSGERVSIGMAGRIAPLVRTRPSLLILAVKGGILPPRRATTMVALAAGTVRRAIPAWANELATGAVAAARQITGIVTERT